MIKLILIQLKSRKQRKTYENMLVKKFGVSRADTKSWIKAMACGGSSKDIAQRLMSEFLWGKVMNQSFMIADSWQRQYSRKHMDLAAPPPEFIDNTRSVKDRSGVDPYELPFTKFAVPPTAAVLGVLDIKR